MTSASPMKKVSTEPQKGFICFISVVLFCHLCFIQEDPLRCHSLSVSVGITVLNYFVHDVRSVYCRFSRVAIFCAAMHFILNASVEDRQIGS